MFLSGDDLWFCAFFLSAAFGLYFLQRSVVQESFGTGNGFTPVSMFYFAMFVGVVCVVFGGGYLVFCVFVLESMVRSAAFVCGVLIAINFVISAYVLRRDRNEAATVQSRLLRYPPRRFQFRPADLMTAVVSFGLIMLAFFNLLLMSDEKVTFAVYALVTQLIGFAISMDIFRFGEPPNRFERVGTIACIAVVSSVPYFIVLVIFSWKAWRYALWACRLNST